jgi:serine protease Do
MLRARWVRRDMEVSSMVSRSSGAVRGALLALFAIALALVVAGCSGGQDTPGPKAENVVTKPTAVARDIPEDEPVARVAAQVDPSVVQVNVRAIQETPFGAQEGQSIGSGVIYRKDGYIITNNHVVEGAQEVNVAFADGTTLKGRVVGTDPNTDLGVIKVDRDNLPAAAFDTKTAPIIGQLAVAIGSPSGFQSTVTAGVVSGLNRNLPAEYTAGDPQEARALVDLIQTDAAISPGNSGGALVNRKGQVMGINVAYLPQTQSGAPVEGIGFAIPARTAASVADEIISTGHASTPYVGVRTEDLTPEAAQQFGLKVTSGVLVASITPNSPASAAGIRRGDVITAINNTKVENSSDLFAALRNYNPGDTVNITLANAQTGDQRTVQVQLAQLPQQQ